MKTKKRRWIRRRIRSTKGMKRKDGSSNTNSNYDNKERKVEKAMQEYIQECIIFHKIKLKIRDHLELDFFVRNTFFDKNNIFNVNNRQTVLANRLSFFSGQIISNYLCLK